MAVVQEYRIPLPISVDEYRIAQLYSVAEASKNETGGGEGVKIIANRPYENDPLNGGSGQYTHKMLHLKTKLPSMISLLSPTGLVEVREESWNAYPYCRTLYTNPYMKDAFKIDIQTWYKPDRVSKDDLGNKYHTLTPSELSVRKCDFIDIINDPVSTSDYKIEEDPSVFKSKKTGRGPIKGADWYSTCEPYMCAYKLYKVEFKWMGLQSKVQSMIMRFVRRLLSIFHRQLFCWMDKWHGLTLEDVRKIEEKTKLELDSLIGQVPSAPRHLQATALSSNSIQLVWIIPAQQNGIITTIEIRWKQLSNTQIRRKRQTAVSGNEHSIVIAVQQQALGMTRKHVVSKLEPYTVYSFRVRERTVNGWGLFTDSIQMTTQEAASSSPADMKVVSTSSSTISISWKTPAEPRGHIKHYVMQCYEEDGVLKYHVNISAGNSVTASYQGVCRNLKSNTETIIEVFAVSSVRGKTGTLKAKTSDKAASGVPWIPIIGGSVGFIAVVALLVTIVLLCRSRPKYEEVNETFDEIELNGGTVKSRPVHISNLKQYIDHNHTNSDHGFFTEYESIKPATAHLTWEHSQQACNQHKNRYSNVVAYDHTRVVLDEISNQEGSTYINANFVDGYKHPRKFIATQGPLPETVDDFWRMIYEQKCHVIIMLTRMIECNRVKCEQYWPDHDSNEYGDIVVTHVDSTELSDYVVRTFSVNTVYDVDQPGQEVKQYHYLGWPDHGVPEYPTSMVTFTKNVMDSVPPKPGPIVVHCSAGVGRTGTLIVIDAMLNQIRDESIVDVYWFISHIRKQRNFMVQTEAQYIFIYDGLLDAVICGNTEVYAKDIAKKCHYLNQHSPDTNDTYLRQEFKRLEAGLSSQEKELFSVANLPENKEKNRFLNILPFNRNRVKLASIYGVKGSDYINASFIDGYRQRHVYIGTQAPLEGTVQDFWRMRVDMEPQVNRKVPNTANVFDVFHEDVAFIVMPKIKMVYIKRQKFYHLKILLAINETYGKFLVDSLSENEDESSHICQQQLNLTYNETGRSRRVNHHMFTGWPDYGSPNSGRDIIKLVRTIQEMTAIRGNGPVAVHCSGGAGRTGTFIALCICTQKLRAAGSVDIFQTVRQLRTQRPAMVQTIDQYYFIYQALKDFVDTSECLSNNVEFNHETFA
eukprot:gene7797-8643_t